MIKNFNGVPMLKSSEDCKKFSKSVSYETLVIGAATIGRECVQTRRLSKGSADKPLTAVGTLTSLLCNSAKVKALSFLRLRGASGAQGISAPASCREAHKRRFILNQWILRFVCTPLRMTIPTLALLFTLITTAESQAEVINCVNGKYADGTACEKCGDNCNWSFDTMSGKLSVTGSGKMYDYSGTWVDHKWVTNNPWANMSIMSKIKSVDVQGVENIGSSAFSGSGLSLKQANIGDSVKSIGQGAFYWADIKEITLPESLEELKKSAFEYSGLTGAVIPDSVTDINSRAFAFNDNFSTVIIPDTLKNIDGLAIFSQNYDMVKIICKGSEKTCAELKKQAQSRGYNVDDNFSYANSEQCTKSYIYENGVCHKRNEYQCNSTENYYWNGSGCVYRPSNGKISCYGTSHKENDGYCDRIRYTPAEAAQVLRDEDKNEVTITFKK